MKLRWLIHGAHYVHKELQVYIPNKGWTTVPEVEAQTKEDQNLEAELAAIAQGIE